MEIYAEFTKKQVDMIETGEIELCLPYDVRFVHKIGKRGCELECDNPEALDNLIEGLEASGVSWQLNNVDCKEEDEKDMLNVLKSHNVSIGSFKIKKNKNNEEALYRDSGYSHPEGLWPSG